jgi:hypothetical protein
MLFPIHCGTLRANTALFTLKLAFVRSHLMQGERSSGYNVICCFEIIENKREETK